MRAFIKKGKLHLVTREFHLVTRECMKGIWVEIPETEIAFTKVQTRAIKEAVVDELAKDLGVRWQ